MPDPAVFKKKLDIILSKLHSEAHLLIASKLRTPDEIKIYYQLGHRDFGENRVQDLVDKSQLLKLSCPEIRWHMIGHLQSNKVNSLLEIPRLTAIHSVHDQHLLDKLMKAEERLDHPVDVYLQFNTSGEDEKSGFETYTDLLAAAETLRRSKKFVFKGLMTMGKIRTNHFEADARQCFQLLNVEKAKLESELNLKLETSMGMSQDYEIALQERSNWIRLGTMMFEG